MKTPSERRAVQKTRLFKLQNGLCYWCHSPIVLVLKVHIKHRPWNFATLDHLDDRFSPERGKHSGELRRVLSCRRCNESRGRESEKSQPLEELQKRSKPWLYEKE